MSTIEQTQDQKPQVQVLHALTGLRFLAAFAVFAHHVSGRFGIEKERMWLGALGVSFFFVLPGFILTYDYHDKLKRENLAKFYFTRWARIWPLHIATMLMFFILVGGWRYYFQGAGFSRAVCNFLLLQSWVPIKSYVFSLNGVSWSISTEMFFYAMFPLFLLGGERKFWRKYVGLLIILLVTLATLNQLSKLPSLEHIEFKSIGHVNPFLRLPEFCTGMAVGFLFLRRRAIIGVANANSIWLDSLKELASIAVLFFTWKLVRDFKIIHMIGKAEWGGPFLSTWLRFTFTVFAFSFLIYVFASSKGILAKFFGSRILVFLGEISFAFYMCHLMIMIYFDQRATTFGSLPPLCVAACCFAIAIAVSVLLYKLVEMPFKSALLNLYNRQFKTALTGFCNSVFQFAKSPLAIAAVLLIGCGIGPLHYFGENPQVPAEHSHIVDSTPPVYRSVEFGGEMLLLGYETEPKRGGFVLRLVWYKMQKLTRRRYVHICDADAEPLFHGGRNDDLLNNTPVGETCIDEVFIKNEWFKDASSIGVGFHGLGIGMANVSAGPRTLGKRRLQVMNEHHLSVVRARQKRLFERQPKPN